MKTRAFTLLLSLLLFSELSLYSSMQSMQQYKPSSVSLIVNNRPLVRVNGKVISLVDVIKKMDMLIYAYSPDLFQSPISLFQFYNSQWKTTLEEMVFNELTLADAKERELKVSDGDVREEMEERFGPNIIATLDKLNLRHEEVQSMIHDELIVRQMQGYKIYSKAHLSVTPEMIKSAYAEYLKNNPPKINWNYQVVSARGDDESYCENLISSIYEKLSTLSSKEDIESYIGSLQSDEEIKERKVQISLSSDFSVDDTNLSKQHKDVLSSLGDGQFSSPVKQHSKNSGSSVFRIFHLDHLEKTLAKGFNDLHDDLKNELLDKSAKKEQDLYKEYLGKKFGYDIKQNISEITTDGYEPFVLK